MRTANTHCYTATFEHQVPGERVEMAAVSYDLQYTKSLVDELVKRNPPASTDVQGVRVSAHELTRVNHYGTDPGDETRRICAIGVGDGEDRATHAATNAWFDYHASRLFTDKVGEERTHKLSIRRPVPGAPAQRAATVGVLYELEFMRLSVDAAVLRNQPTHDDYQVVEAGDLTLMRVNLYGLHPLESSRHICVGGIADRHYRAVAAAELAWVKYHTSLLFGAQALGSF